MNRPKGPAIGVGVAAQGSSAEWIGRSVMILWLVYLLVTPTVGLGWIDSWHNEQRAAQIALLCLTAVVYVVAGLSTDVNDAGIRWSFPPLLLVFLAIGIVSALLAPFKFAALAEVGLAILLAVFTFFTAQTVAWAPLRAVRWARWFALLFGTAYVLGVATRFLAAVNLGRGIDLDVWILGYANPRFASAFHTLLIPFLAMTVLEPHERRLLRVGAAVILSLLWAINVGLGTRGIWFAYALAVPALIALAGWRKAARLGGVVAVTAVAGSLLYYMLVTLAQAMADNGPVVPGSSLDLTTLTSRDVLWRLSWDAIASSPWLGLGPMQFAALGSRVGAHPHNWILQIAAEWGLPALLIVLYAVFQLARAARHALNQADVAGPFLAVAAALALGLVDGNLVMPVSQSAAALVLGLLLGLLHQPWQRGHQVVEFASARALTAFLCVAACGLVIAYAASSSPEQKPGASEFRKSNPGAWLVPRFWEQGLIVQ